eukprot:m51a1_g2026 hypothetical protein (140) ;mRNA; r:1297980-1298893
MKDGAALQRDKARAFWCWNFGHPTCLPFIARIINRQALQMDPIEGVTYCVRPAGSPTWLRVTQPCVLLVVACDPCSLRLSVLLSGPSSSSSSQPLADVGELRRGLTRDEILQLLQDPEFQSLVSDIERVFEETVLAIPQ